MHFNRTPTYMSLPILDENGKLHTVIQVAAKTKAGSNLSKGFKMADENFLYLFSRIMQSKIYEMSAQLEIHRVEKQLIMSLNLASMISTQRSCSDLTLVCNELLPSYLGFEGLGLLFRDTKDNTLFSMDSEFNEEEQKFYDEIKEKKRKAQLLTQDERMKDFERQLGHGTKYKYPNSIGLTGEVYKSQEIVWTNSIKRLKKFIPNMDNLSKAENVRSILVAPLFGHAEQIGDKDLILVGIIQLINKIDGNITQ